MPTHFCLVPLRKILIGFSVFKTRWRFIAGHAVPCCTHSSGILQHLNWLHVNQCIKFKLATLTHNILSCSQPAYLRQLLSHHAPTRSLCSANTNLLSVPHVRTTFVFGGISVAAPTVWNSLPPTIRNSSSTHTFRRLLKTHCFWQAFSSH